jgi:hypothetical protein
VASLALFLSISHYNSILQIAIVLFDNRDFSKDTVSEVGKPNPPAPFPDREGGTSPEKGESLQKRGEPIISSLILAPLLLGEGLFVLY